jgi:hypothetical protein
MVIYLIVEVRTSIIVNGKQSEGYYYFYIDDSHWGYLGGANCYSLIH